MNNKCSQISMLDATLFDKLDYIARKIRNNPAPFGGIHRRCRVNSMRSFYALTNLVGPYKFILCNYSEIWIFTLAGVGHLPSSSPRP